MVVIDCFISLNNLTCGISEVCFVYVTMSSSDPFPGYFIQFPQSLLWGFFHLLYSPDLGDCSSDEIRTIFRVFDQDGDGFISTAELRHVTTMVGEPMTAEELDAMVMEADLDKDGRISFEGRATVQWRHMSVMASQIIGNSTDCLFNVLFTVGELRSTLCTTRIVPRRFLDVRSILQRHLLDVRTTSYINWNFRTGWNGVYPLCYSGQKISKPWITGPSWGESTDEFPSQRVRNAESCFYMSWHHHLCLQYKV